MKRGNERVFVIGKKAQFYLTAAIVISMLIIGFSALANSSRKTDTTVKLSNYGQELRTESAKVIDYGTHKGYDSAQMKELVKDFIDNYTSYSSDGKNMYFVFGETTGITFVGYSEKDETISLNTGATENPITLHSREKFTEDFTPDGNPVGLTIEGIKYSFNLGEGENFYFVLEQNIGGENYAATNQN